MYYCPSLGLWNYKYNGVWVLTAAISPTISIDLSILSLSTITMVTEHYQLNGRPYFTGGGWTIWWNGSKYVLSQKLGVQTYKVDIYDDGNLVEQILSFSCSTLSGTYVSNETTPRNVTAAVSMTVVGSCANTQRGGDYTGGSQTYHVGWQVAKDTPKTTGYRSRIYYMAADGELKLWFYGTEVLGEGILEADTDPAGYTRTTLGYALDGELCDETGVRVTYSSKAKQLPNHVEYMFYADANILM